MKKSVVDIYDLQEMAPFFKGRVGTWLGKLLIRYMPGIVIYGALSLLPLYCMTPLSISAMRFIIRRF